MERSFPCMGTRVGLTVLPAPGQAAAAAATLDAITGWFQAAEATLSRFRPDSELNRLVAAAGAPCLVSPLLAGALAAALALADDVFDPTVRPCLEAAGYDRDLASVQAAVRAPAPGAPTPPAGWRPGRWREIGLDARYGLATLPPGVALDLGGIAKGWAADQACAALAGHGPALVDAGGDLAIRLPPGAPPWPVAVADPFREEADLLELAVAGGGVATSSILGRRWAGSCHHIIDPRTGCPASTDLVQVTVLAPTCARAEAWAKAALILGAAAGRAYLAARGAAGVLVTQDGEVIRHAL